MIRPIYLLMAASLFIAQTTNAQRFINGDMDPKTGTHPCHYITNTDFHDVMREGGTCWSDTLITSSTPCVYLLAGMNKDTCGEGKGLGAVNDYFLGMRANKYGSDAISLELEHGMDAGKSYTITFYIKKSVASGLSATGLDFGYSNTPGTIGTSMGAVPAPSSTAWTIQTFTFSPLTNAKFINIKAQKTGSTDLAYTFIDSFHINDYYNLDVKTTAGSLPNPNIYPNPMNDIATITIPEAMGQPCRLAVYDMAGRLVYQQKDINSKTTTINRSNIGAGLYLLRLTDENNNVSASRLIVE